MKPDILLIEPMMASIEESLDQNYVVHRLFASTDPMSLLANIGTRIRGVATGGGSGVSPTIFDALPNLEIIAINGVGTDAVDLNKAKARGVRVTTTPNVLTDDVADLGIALLLAVSRGLCVGDRFVRAGHWPRQAALPLARKITGKRLGIFGMGRIGRAIARRAEPFDMKIAYTDLNPVADVSYEFVPDAVVLASRSDFFVIAAAGGQQSRSAIGRKVFEALGPDGFVINVARGSVVDEDALVAALIERRIGGAGLDVFADEPNVPSALLGLDNVVLQPHRASATIETRIAMGELVLANLAAHFAGMPLKSPVI
jgi:lactate dehydrogenase-like 2-hydroxyacid dehydrogenase